MIDPHTDATSESATANGRIGNLEKSVGMWEYRYAEAKKESANKDKEIAEMDKRIAEMDKRIAELDREIAEKEAAIARMGAES